MRDRDLDPDRRTSRAARRTPRALAFAAALATAGCTSPDYTYARETRNERPYRGGAASVPDEEPEDPRVKSPTPLDVFAFFGVIALFFTRPESYSPGRPQSQLGTASPPPSSR